MKGATNNICGDDGEEIVSTRAPVKGATFRELDTIVFLFVSTRAPVKGATRCGILLHYSLNVSTRAPVKGATTTFHSPF